MTGGGGDIGGAICQDLDRHGARVVVLDIDAAGGQRTARTAQAPQGAFLLLDVSDSAAVTAAFEEIAKSCGRIDGLVNAAGIAPVIDCLDTDDETWRRTIDINLSGVHYCSREAAKVMVRQGRGAIVNISSTNGLVGEEKLVAYNASKFGVMGVTKTMAAELGERGVRVNAVNPGSSRPSSPPNCERTRSSSAATTRNCRCGGSASRKRWRIA